MVSQKHALKMLHKARNYDLIVANFKNIMGNEDEIVDVNWEQLFKLYKTAQQSTNAKG